MLNEIPRCADEVLKAGGDTIRIAGDVFHVRGSVAPSVLNPTLEVVERVIALGIKIEIEPGNHDLEGKKSTRLGSAVTALEKVGCKVIHEMLPSEDHNCLYVPWTESVKELREKLESINPSVRENYDLILHAPIDGVLPHLSGGLDPKWLADLGFRRVFAGHYHNFKDFGNGVYSIGALAHHTWSDVHSKAGFLIVSKDEVRWMKSHLPEFVDITGDTDEDEIPLLAEGNFVRAKVTTEKMSDVEAVRQMLTDAGAKGVVIQTVKKPVTERTGSIAATVDAGASLEVSISEFVKSQSFEDADAVNQECQRVLAEVGA